MTHCNTLQHAATHCNTLQHTATHGNALQHIATICNMLQHAATHCNTWRKGYAPKQQPGRYKVNSQKSTSAIVHCKSLHYTATPHCNNLQPPATPHCNILQQKGRRTKITGCDATAGGTVGSQKSTDDTVHCNTLQHAAAHCKNTATPCMNTLQHSAPEMGAPQNHRLSR